MPRNHLSHKRCVEIARMVTQTDDGHRIAELADHVADIVARFPPLSAQQRDRLAVLLRPVPVSKIATTPAIALAVHTPSDVEEG